MVGDLFELNVKLRCQKVKCTHRECSPHMFQSKASNVFSKTKSSHYNHQRNSKFKLSNFNTRICENKTIKMSGQQAILK